MKRSFAAVFALFGCASSIELAPSGPHPPHVQDFQPVDYPPPPAQVEELPGPHQNDSCVWVDGHYGWDGRYTWHPGIWVVPEPGCYYAPPVIGWSRAGDRRLYFTPPRWYREDALSLSGPAALCPAPRPCPSQSL